MRSLGAIPPITQRVPIPDGRFAAKWSFPGPLSQTPPRGHVGSLSTLQIGQIEATSLQEVSASFDPGALLGASYALSDGSRVRLRLARSSDAPEVRALLASLGEGAQPVDLEVGRLVHFDPRKRCVLAATALVDGRETLTGFGSIAIDGTNAVPDAVVVGPQAAPGVAELLTDALIGRAEAIARTRAA
jgi:hypothetical protein